MKCKICLKNEGCVCICHDCVKEERKKELKKSTGIYNE